ncbi:hypothetical protein NBRC110019_08270 [Neptunitalea chrysea]|uniref:Carboxypeptidase regulatory-like domain-containing protein n=1 Tax=Neptunitalea chrysea TaxID=1647581 RepID=A0A9W6EVP2_9FLAO|nr:hypothetical protein [Neptunitalea chrysea]GLB51788.1 hypothetical protein NBRC110019_08270 [Neptunitalea chrysea]
MDNTRTYFEGTITDESGNPLENIPVTYKGGGLVLGYDYTDENGIYSFYSLETSSDSPCPYFKVNDINEAYDQSYSSYTYKENTDHQDRALSTTYDIALKKIVQLEVSVIKISTSSDTYLDWTISFPDDSCFEVNSTEDEYYNQCYSEHTASFSQTPTNPNTTETITTVSGETAQFSYSINDGAVTYIDIPLTQENTTYEFEY